MLCKQGRVKEGRTLQKHSGPEPETGGTKHVGVTGAEPHREQLRAVATASGGVHHANAGPAAGRRGAHEGRDSAPSATAAAAAGKVAASRPAPASAAASGSPQERVVATSTFALPAAPSPPPTMPAAPATKAATSHYDATGGQAAASSSALAPRPAVGQPGVPSAGGKLAQLDAQKMGVAEAPAGQTGLPTTAKSAQTEGAEAGNVGAKMRLPTADFDAALGHPGRASLSFTVSNAAVESQGAAGAR